MLSEKSQPSKYTLHNSVYIAWRLRRGHQLPKMGEGGMAMAMAGSMRAQI
jgi:hypothetical protein